MEQEVIACSIPPRKAVNSPLEPPVCGASLIQPFF